MEGWKDGRTTVPSVRVSLLSVKWPISERSEKGGQVKSWRLINSEFCLLFSDFCFGVAGRQKSGDQATTRYGQEVTVGVVDPSQDTVGSQQAKPSVRG
jgi:hypothetical protein